MNPTSIFALRIALTALIAAVVCGGISENTYGKPAEFLRLAGGWCVLVLLACILVVIWSATVK